MHFVIYLIIGWTLVKLCYQFVSFNTRKKH